MKFTKEEINTITYLIVKERISVNLLMREIGDNAALKKRIDALDALMDKVYTNRPFRIKEN